MGFASALGGRGRIAAATTLFIAGAIVASACGGAGASPASTATAAVAGMTADASSRMPGRFGNRTPSSAIQTAIAEGTPFGPGNRTPNAGIQTAIAEGTVPAGGFRGMGGGRVVTTVASLLAIDETQLRSELQADGATIASVAAAHGFDRGTLRQALIDATRQRFNDAVTNGTITQQMADASESQFESSVDRVLDSNGSGPGGPAAP